MTDSIRLDLRIPEEDLREIDRRAKARGLSRTKFMLLSALNRLPEHETSRDEAWAELRNQVERHERLLLGNNDY